MLVDVKHLDVAYWDRGYCFYFCFDFFDECAFHEEVDQCLDFDGALWAVVDV